MTGLVHRDDYYETPPIILDLIQRQTGLTFGLDVCANEQNKICQSYISEGDDSLTHDWCMNSECKPTVFCNPPASKNSKFVRKAFEQWNKLNIDIIFLMRWNDFGNKYGQECVETPMKWGQLIERHNLGKVIFYKSGQPSKFPSRLNYCWIWFKKRPEMLQIQL